MSDALAIAAVFLACFLAGFCAGRRMPRKSKPAVVIAASPLRIVAPLPGSRHWEVKR